MDSFISFFESIKINTFDVIVSVVVLFNIISSTKKGFVLSVISFLKWIIAFVIAKFSIPYVVPYINEIIKNETTARVVSGVTVFLLSLFLIIVLGKAIGKSMKWVGLGAMFHDIGKLKIPSQILRKTTPLTTPELNFLKLHPQLRQIQMAPAFLNTMDSSFLQRHASQDQANWLQAFLKYALDNNSL